MESVELVSNSQSKGRARLRVEDSALFWGDDISYDYLSIVLHAICKDLDTFPKPCIYMQVQVDRKDDDAEVEEIYLVPEREDQVDELFAQLSRCAALHVDPESEAEEDGSGDMVFGQFDDAM